MKFPSLFVFAFLLCARSWSQQIAFTIPEKDILVEGITVDTATGDFYLSSIFKDKIVKVSKGKPSDFIKTDYEGFMGGVGLHVDAQRRILLGMFGKYHGE